MICSRCQADVPVLRAAVLGKSLSPAVCDDCVPVLLAVIRGTVAEWREDKRRARKRQRQGRRRSRAAS